MANFNSNRLDGTPVFHKQPAISFTRRAIYTQREDTHRKKVVKEQSISVSSTALSTIFHVSFLRSSSSKGLSRRDSTSFLLPLSPSQHIRHTVGITRATFTLSILWISGHFKLRSHSRYRRDLSVGEFYQARSLAFENTHGDT